MDNADVLDGLPLSRSQVFQEWKVVLRRLCVEDELVLLERDEGGFPAGLTTGLEQWQGKRVSCAGFLTLVAAAPVPVVQQTCVMSVHIFTPSIPFRYSPTSL